MASVEEQWLRKRGGERGRHCCVLRKLMLPLFLTKLIHISFQVGRYLCKILAFPDYSKGVDICFRLVRYNDKSKFCFAASSVVPSPLFQSFESFSPSFFLLRAKTLSMGKRQPSCGHQTRSMR